MNTLDAPSRESCTVRRERTNTPLQALLMMNETQFIEASRALAQRTLHAARGTPQDRIAFMFRVATARLPDHREAAELLAAFTDFRTGFGKDPASARKLIAHGETKPDMTLDPVELAAWTMLGNVILNLDEVMNKG